MQPSALIENSFRLTPTQKQALKKLGLKTVRGLLYHFPSRYADLGEITTIENLTVGEKATIYGQVNKLKTGKAFRKRISMAEGEIFDNTGKIKIVWFNQPYIAKMIRAGSTVKLSGKVMERKGVPYLANPGIETTNELPIDIGDSLFGKKADSPFIPIYPESRGITSRWFYYTMQKVLQNDTLDKITDPIPAPILHKYHLPNLKTALIWIHSPKKEKHREMARKRFAFEEIFFIQLARQMERIKYAKHKSFIIDKKGEEMEKFTKRFPFGVTSAQIRSIETILSDFRSGRPMSRLLEGDVGSGKTAVAAATAFAAVTTRPNEQSFGALQVAYMAPTEILAAQHFESFIKYFGHLPIQIGLITGSGCRKFPSKVNPGGWTDISRTQLLKWARGGEIAILLGTHAIIQKSVEFKNLAYIIIDEQHRFGTAQRQKLARKSDPLPHLLSMTATPIPRTLALTIYGDLDLSLLDEMPAGRKQIVTEIVPPNKREGAYEKIREELKAGRQAYVICPRIDEPDPAKELALIAKSVKAEAKRLFEKVFPEFSIDILHGKMKPAEKEKVMQEFARGETNILVATSVVEVGVNVPNATLIVIEGAERFGLAQLHQLRGRVIRSTHQPYCFVFSETKTEKTLARLKALVTAKNGFELSELDLALRGAGELSGVKQWGISDLGMEAIKNIKMVEAARTEATEILKQDPELNSHPLLKHELGDKKTSVHLE
ncbi:MAG: ATP-dependent DNA helicase RecG [Patescibacteria group bacterium]